MIRSNRSSGFRQRKLRLERLESRRLLTTWIETIDPAIPIQRAENFDAVGQFGGCTGTLVASNKVLTAAHCVDNDADGQFETDPTGQPFHFGSNAANPDFSVQVLAADVHPDWSPARRQGSDLAMLTLAQQVTSVDPISIVTNDPKGRIGTMVGFGLAGPGSTFDAASTAFDGLRRAIDNTIDQVLPLSPSGPNDGTLWTDFDSPAADTNTLLTHRNTPSSPQPIMHEGMIAPGDSGGPLLVDFGSGARLVAIASAIGNPFSQTAADELGGQYGTISFHAPITHASNLLFLQSHGIQVSAEPELPPDPVVGFDVQWLSAQQVEISWTKSEHADVYQIFGGADSDSQPSLLATVDHSTTSFLATDLVAGQRYRFHVVAENQVGQSTSVVLSGSFADSNDTIRLSGHSQTLDLSDLPILDPSTIETIDLRGLGNNQLIVSPGSLASLSPASDSLTVISAADSRLIYQGSWQVGAPLIDGQLYHHQLLANVDVSTQVQLNLVNDRAHQNPLEPLDVNRDGRVTTLDALNVINRLAAVGEDRDLPVPESQNQISGFYFDANFDNRVTALDALRIINGLGRVAAAQQIDSPIKRSDSIDNPVATEGIQQRLF